MAHAAAAPVIAHAAPAPIELTAPAQPYQRPAGPRQPGPALTHPSSQYHSQDEFGNYEYGYSNINSVKQEAGNTYGGVSGSYSYVDANGLVQTTNYIADDLGFRVQATNLPVGPLPVAPTVLPEVERALIFKSERLPISSMRI